ncbi:MAG: hypothetical protein GX421_02595 [Caldisericales bacterium]|nr:hypothetical protein [Caldisericales bacterium]
MSKTLRIALTIVLPFVVLFPHFATSQSGRTVQIGKGVLSKPHSICVLNGHLFVTDIQLNEILCFSTSGELISRKHTFGETKLLLPSGICSLPTGEIVVADSGNRRILLLDQSMGELRSLVVEEGFFGRPIDVAESGGCILVLDNQKRKVVRLTRFGQLMSSFGDPGIEKGQFVYPTSIAAYGDRIYVCDAGSGQLKEYNQKGGHIESFGSPGRGPESLSWPSDIVFDDLGNQYIVDKYCNDVLVRSRIGNDPVSWGRFGDINSPIDYFHSEDVPSDFSKEPPNIMNRPTGIAIDGECVYVADTENGRVLVESIRTVWQSPRLDGLPFQAQTQDMPAIVVSPKFLDFGNCRFGDTLEILVTSVSYACIEGQCWVEGTQSVSASPHYFRGTVITLLVKVEAKNGPISGYVSLKIGNETFKVLLKGNISRTPGFYFRQVAPNLMMMSEATSSCLVALSVQNGFSGPVELVVSQPKYSPSWAKPAKGVEELTLTTILIEAEPGELDLPETVCTSLTITPIGRMRPGTYTIDIEAKSRKGPAFSARQQLTIMTVTKGADQSLRTCLLETFTAHWCENCGFHREAQCRMAQEYGPRKVLPVAYYTLDENDLEETGITQPGNFERFKLYGGQGVPLTVFNGEVVNFVSGSENRFAPDRIRGRRYSGSTFEYWRMRAAFDASDKIQKLSMLLSTTAKDGKGNIWFSVGGQGQPEDIDLNIIFLLVEDNIYYYSENGEKEHHFVIRDILAQKRIRTGKENYVDFFDFAVKKMPEGYDVKLDNSRIVAFAQNPKTLAVLGATSVELGPRNYYDFDVFSNSGNRMFTPGSTHSVDFFVSNLSNLNQDFTIIASITGGLDLNLSPKTMSLGPGQYGKISSYFSIPGDWQGVDGQIVLTLSVIGSLGDKKSLPIIFYSGIGKQ